VVDLGDDVLEGKVFWRRSLRPFILSVLIFLFSLLWSCLAFLGLRGLRVTSFVSLLHAPPGGLLLEGHSKLIEYDWQHVLSVEDSSLRKITELDL
jgi:hypothetical protein